MVGTAARFFLASGTWHAYRDDENVSLCRSARLSYNADPIADAVPLGAVRCAGCQRVLTGEPVVEPEPKAAAKPKTAAKPRTSTKK